MRRRTMRPRSTRDQILDQLKMALSDTLSAEAPRNPPCGCDECRVARARDVSPDPRILQVQPADFQKIMALGEARGMKNNELTDFSLRMFQKPPALLREIEAAAVIAHLERGEF